jgi:hypothetical protein
MMRPESFARDVMNIFSLKRSGPDDDFERAIWLTGQVDNDLRIGAVTQVPEKIHGALDALDALAKAGKQVLLYVPEENARALANAGLPPGIEAHAVAEAGELLDAIGMPLTPRAAATKTATPGEHGAARPADRHRHKRAALGLVFLVLGGAAVAAGIILPGELIPDQPVPPVVDTAKPTPEPETAVAVISPLAAALEAGPVISIFEVRPTEAGGCPAVHFGADRGVTAEIKAPRGGAVTSTAAADLCAIEFKFSPAPGRPYLAAAIEVISGRHVENEPLPASLRGGQSLSGPVTWRINLPLRMNGPFDYKMHVVSAEHEIAGEVYNAMRGGDHSAASAGGMLTNTMHHTILP